MENFLKIFGAIILTLILIVVLALLMGFPVMWLWNWLMPLIFGLKTITFWQAVGINILCGLLFRSTYTKSNND